MISNPVSFGYYETLKEFTYEGGKTLYHFSPDITVDQIFHHWIPINLIFLANNVEHAKDVLERMLKFADKNKDKPIGDAHRDLPKLLLKNKDKWLITEAPINQFYKVGWACNDTLF